MLWQSKCMFELKRIEPFHEGGGYQVMQPIHATNAEKPHHEVLSAQLLAVGALLSTAAT